MSNLVLDIGNTRIKAAIFEKKELIWEGVFEQIADFLFGLGEQRFDQIIVCSVRYEEQELREMFSFDFLFMSSLISVPISNGYKTPFSLGLDRLAAAVGGWDLSGGGPVLVIDIGTCITFEFVDELGRYKGGAISPGLGMRARAMNQQTAKLPLVQVQDRPVDRVGEDTIGCLRSGIWFGVEYEIIGQIAAFRLEYPKIKVFVCGGDAESFVSLAKGHIFVVPNLVLVGLNCILNHNVE